MNSDDIKKLVVPTPAQILFSLGLTILILGGVYREVWVARLFDNELVPQALFQEGLGLQLMRLNQIPFIRTLVIAAFWGTVGLIAYLLYLAANNTVTEVRNEVVIETEYINKGELEDRFRLPLLQAAWAGLLVLTLVLTALVGLPLWLGLFERFLFNPATVQTIGYLLMAVAGMALNIYSVYTVGQVVFKID